MDECIKKKLIRRIEPSRETALRLMDKAGKMIREAKASWKASAPDSSLLVSYDAMLLSAKAVLMKDGFREKSHYCVVAYIKEVYAEPGKIDRKMVELFDRYRSLRQMVAYDADFTVSDSDANQAINDAEAIVKEFKRLI